MRRICILLLLSLVLTSQSQALTIEKIKFGDMNRWVTRIIDESIIIGGKNKELYEIGPTDTIVGNIAYENIGGSPWATSNAYARVAGVTKGSNTVFPEKRANGDYCCKMGTIVEKVRALGIINLKVLISGSIFLGQIHEPIKSTNSPYSKMEWGIPYIKRPDYLVFDYKSEIPQENKVRMTGFGGKKQLDERDHAEVYVLLQKRWEDEEGNIHALRVGTGRERFSTTQKEWVNGHLLPIHYGDITKESYYKPYMNLIPEDRAYYAKNSKGEMVPIHEEGWAPADAKPTHVLVMASAGCGVAYEGTPGMTLWIDNVAFGFK